MIARSSNDGLKPEAVHLIDRSLVTLITLESASVQSCMYYRHGGPYSHALEAGWKLRPLACMNHGYRSAEGDSRLAELAAATNIKNTKKHSFKGVLRIGLWL